MASHSARDEVDASQLVIRTPGLSETEIAAVTAVLMTALREQASAAVPTADAPYTAWRRSQRGLRAPLQRGPGAWRRWN
ncbi:acyl-CoA carboxylase subunit epsilon [Humibacter albus]|jgi:hypothetical protein|uniref:acyl-CoA carboxylase subunit epsilon n=1 Tax=Humibacter albus TaxID=427754 RepID=UPI0003B50DFC|nr:acyl-CoA carboxylase subunit epsilon [Humibacter albus]